MRILLVLLLVAVAGIGYWYWTTTPKYSVGQIKDAIKAHDLSKFHKYVDTESVASGMADDFLTAPVRKAFGEGIVGEVLMAGLRGFIKPELAQGLNREICEYVEMGDFKNSSEEGEGSPSSLSALNRRLGFTGHAFKGVPYLKTQGKVALVGMEFHNNEFNKDLVLEAQMRDMGGYWQMTRLTNFPHFVGQIMTMQMEKQGGTDSDGKPLNSTWSLDIRMPTSVR